LFIKYIKFVKQAIALNIQILFYNFIISVQNFS
jgi:hypothetical protein